MKSAAEFVSLMDQLVRLLRTERSAIEAHLEWLNLRAACAETRQTLAERGLPDKKESLRPPGIDFFRAEQTWGGYRPEFNGHFCLEDSRQVAVAMFDHRGNVTRVYDKLANRWIIYPSLDGHEQ